MDKVINYINDIRGNEELLNLLKLFLTITVPALYLWFLSTNPVNYHDAKTIGALICFWTLLIVIVFLHIKKDNLIEYKLGTIGIFIIPVIFCYLAYNVPQIELILSYYFILIYLLSFFGNCIQHIKNRYYQIIILGRGLLPFFFIYLSNNPNHFYQNSLFNVLVISTWFIVFLIILPYGEKIREKEKMISQ